MSLHTQPTPPGNQYPGPDPRLTAGSADGAPAQRKSRKWTWILLAIFVVLLVVAVAALFA